MTRKSLTNPSLVGRFIDALNDSRTRSNIIVAILNIADNLPEVFTTSIIRDSQDQNVRYREKHSSRQSLYNLLDTLGELLFIRRVKIVDVTDKEIKDLGLGYIKTTYCLKMAYFLKYYLEIENIWDIFASSKKAKSVFNPQVEARIEQLREGLDDEKSWVFTQISSIFEIEPAFLDMTETVFRISSEHFLRRKKTELGFSRKTTIKQIFGNFEKFLRAIRNDYSRSVYIPVYVDDGFWRFIPVEFLNDPDFLKTPLMKLVPHDIQKAYSPADTGWFTGYGIVSLDPSDERVVPDFIGFFTPRSVTEVYLDFGIEQFEAAWSDRKAKMRLLNPDLLLRPLVLEKIGVLENGKGDETKSAEEHLESLRNRLLSMKVTFRQAYSDLFDHFERVLPRFYHPSRELIEEKGIGDFPFSHVEKEEKQSIKEIKESIKRIELQLVLGQRTVPGIRSTTRIEQTEQQRLYTRAKPKGPLDQN